MEVIKCIPVEFIIGFLYFVSMSLVLYFGIKKLPDWYI